MNHTTFIEAYREAVTSLIQAADRLDALRAHYDAVDLGGALTNEDVPAGLGLSKNDIINAVAAADAAVAAARVTPLAKLRTRA